MYGEILDWFEVGPDLRNHQPIDKGWTISEILEHIILTSHYLLILIDKGTSKALKNIQNESLVKILNNYRYELKKLDEIGIHKSFKWIRPKHMEPTGSRTDFELKSELIQQLTRCLNYLDQLKNGEGLLYRTTMTVNELGKINVYEYIYFLSKHAERHIQQMEKNKQEYENLKSKPSLKQNNFKPH